MTRVFVCVLATLALSSSASTRQAARLADIKTVPEKIDYNETSTTSAAGMPIESRH
ncbi:MAG: hypothetical protein ACRD15_09280 [Vicinamibacterales bacterium]